MKILLVFAGFISQAAIAQDTEEKTVFSPVTTIDMGEVDVSATVVKPELKTISEAPRPRFAPWIILRQDFTDHAREDAAAIK